MNWEQFNFPEWSQLKFLHPELLWLLLVIPLLIVWYILKNKQSTPEILISSTSVFKTVKPSGGLTKLLHLPFIFRILALALGITALARPQTSMSWRDIKTEGIDIIMTMDVSTSMLAQDFKPNRLAAAKTIGAEFIESRPDDRIGLVVFAGQSFTQCPLTLDHNMLVELLQTVDPKLLGDGTAIGSGLATASARLKNSEAASKVVILLTDGVNNQGSISPLTAAEIAKSYGIRLYIIGIGTKGKALSPVAMYPNGEYVFEYVDVQIDEPLMDKMASMTDGKYFRATDNEKLRAIYAEIDKLEKTRLSINDFSQKNEEFLFFLFPAFCLVLTEWFLRYTLFRSTP